MMEKETLSSNVPTMKMFAPSWDPNDEMMKWWNDEMTKWWTDDDKKNPWVRLPEWQSWDEVARAATVWSRHLPRFWGGRLARENDLRRWSGRIFWSFFVGCSYNLIWKMRETILTRICSNFYNNKKVIKMRLRRRRIEMIILIKCLLNFLCVCVFVGDKTPIWGGIIQRRGTDHDVSIDKNTNTVTNQITHEENFPGSKLLFAELIWKLQLFLLR